jgi:hypothetical protein
MNALAELRKRARTAANPANPANQGRQTVADSQDSQGVQAETHFSTAAAVVPLTDTLKPLRMHLLALAARQAVDAAHIHRLHDLDVAACAGLDDGQLAAYLDMLRDTADRHAGRVPLDDTAPMHCEQCGPVWVHPSIAAVLPVVAGWPRALGCPWCAIRKAGGYIPRPRVTCETCTHWKPDTINPAAGVGDCASGHGTHYPMQRHGCGDFTPENTP